MIGRLTRALAVLVTAFILALGLYVGFIQSGLIRSPLAPVVKGDLDLARSDQEGVRVLFVGDSLTYYNDMPTMVHELAEVNERGPRVFAVSYTRPGFSLRQAAEQQALSQLLAEIRWDYVVLQENFDLIAYGGVDGRMEASEPYARMLDAKIDRRGARTLLFLTWGVESDFLASQEALNRGYGALAFATGASIVAVGDAWKQALKLWPPLDLWNQDGGHPSLSGSYLTACTFYAYLTGNEATESSFTAGVPRDEARFLQRIASESVH